jgi:hypothetical protein
MMELKKTASYSLLPWSLILENHFLATISLDPQYHFQGKSTKEAFSLTQGPSIVLSIKERIFFLVFHIFFNLRDCYLDISKVMLYG